MKRKRIYSEVQLSGIGKTEEEAWADAVQVFQIDPGEPLKVSDVQEDVEDWEGSNYE